MATIRFHETNEVIENSEQVKKFLETQGVIYEQWDISKLPSHLVEKYDLTDDDKNEILVTFKSEIAEISERRGYKAHDIITLSDANPNLDQMLENFKQEHHHEDDEVRFIAGGTSIFAIEGSEQKWFDVRLNPGDLISVPESTRHYFTLAEDRKTVAIRIFVTAAGWVPIYEKDEVQA
ncbi:cupin domain-containing protein [Peribacillus butanolivorans]|uniref:cupin domain-containing protein n=1 Tax=Peribacillus butanolivorans TaxID=421767 RepID=UPI00207D0C53|nr:cupin domain-containing protein [Peribacillus butanolivorans]MCO0599287.1 cupin domain-containing protein [Peribacillus butanolivorans]